MYEVKKTVSVKKDHFENAIRIFIHGEETALEGSDARKIERKIKKWKDDGEDLKTRIKDANETRQNVKQAREAMRT